MKWIDVHERLPESSKVVLITYRSGPRADSRGRRSVHMARYGGGLWRFLDQRSKTKLPERVTHWAEIDLPHKVAHTDHQMRHWDRTCPACQQAETEF